MYALAANTPENATIIIDPNATIQPGDTAIIVTLATAHRQPDESIAFTPRSTNPIATHKAIEVRYAPHRGNH